MRESGGDGVGSGGGCGRWGVEEGIREAEEGGVGGTGTE